MSDLNSLVDIGDIRALIGNSPAFRGPQANRQKAFCQVIIGGVDITSKLEPHLLSLRIMDGYPKHGAEIEVDDRDARLPIPPIDTEVKISLGWRDKSGTADSGVVFTGRTQDIEFGVSRQEGGRKFTVNADGESQFGDAKSPHHFHLGDGAPAGKEQGEPITLQAFLEAAAKNAGLTIKINPKLAKIERDYWSQNNESFAHLLQRLSRDVGGKARIINGTEAELTLPKEDVTGGTPTTCYAKWGDNLIAARVRPLAARATWATANQSYYSTKAAEWKKVTSKLGLRDPWSKGVAAYALPAPASNAGSAQNDVDGVRRIAGAGPGGHGRIVVNGEPKARSSSYVQLQNVRPGVDGRYWILVAEHLYNRDGYVTWLDVMPDAEAANESNVGSGWSSVTATGSGTAGASGAPQLTPPPSVATGAGASASGSIGVDIFDPGSPKGGGIIDSGAPLPQAQAQGTGTAGASGSIDIDVFQTPISQGVGAVPF